MNKVIFIFSFVCIFYSAQSQTSGDFILSNEVVYGNVLKIYQLTAEIPPGTSLEDPQNVRLAVGKIIDFNSHGQNVTVREMIPDGYEIKKTEYSYNSQNKPISGKVSTAQKRVAINLSFSYNGKGNLSEIRTIDTKDSVLLQEQRYNYSKRYLEIIQKNYGQLPAHYRHRVENGRLVESTLLDSSGQIIETTVRQYNSKGILEQTIKKDVAGQEINRVAFTYEFDEKGNWTKELSHDQQTDRYKLRTQSIVYRDEKLRIPSEEELQGIWSGWMNKEVLFLLDGKHAMLKTGKNKMENQAFNYNTLSGEFSLSDAFLKNNASFTAWLDSKVLILRQSSPERMFYFIKNEIGKTSVSDPAFYEYNQKSETEFISFREGKLLGIKTQNGNVILRAEYEDAYRANNKIIKAKRNGKWALFNSQGKQLTEFQFQEVRREIDDYLVCVDSISALFAPDGKKILQGAYEKMKITNSKVVCVIQRKHLEERYGVFDLKGQVILPLEYKSIRFLDNTGESGIIAVSDKDSKSTTWFDKNFKAIRTFQGQVGITPLGANFFMLKFEQFKGMLDAYGNTLIEPVYEDLHIISAHLLAAKKAGKFGLIDIKGKEVTPFIYDNILSENLKKGEPVGIEYYIAQSRSAALFVKDGDFGYLNGYGKEVKPTLIPLYISQQLSKTFELPGLLKFSYPYNWKQQADYLDSGDQTGHAMVKVKTVSYTGNILEWLQKNRPDKEWLPYKMERKPAYSSIEIKNVQTGVWQEQSRSQKLFIALNDVTALELSFDCTNFFYPHLAQDFYTIIHSIKLND